ncbi:MAG TPA: MFS transporter, partial [Franconibacter pulveris]|nr:MFS transporter [Franconibacter pulveris]
LSLGMTGPLAGVMMAYAGVPMIYLASAALVLAALGLAWRLKKRPLTQAPEAGETRQ